MLMKHVHVQLVRPPVLVRPRPHRLHGRGRDDWVLALAALFRHVDHPLGSHCPDISTVRPTGGLPVGNLDGRSRAVRRVTYPFSVDGTSASFSSPQSIRAWSGSSNMAPVRLDPRKSHAHDTNESTRSCTPLMRYAWTPSQEANATCPWSSWWCAPISATAAPLPIMAMMPLSL